MKNKNIFEILSNITELFIKNYLRVCYSRYALLLVFVFAAISTWYIQERLLPRLQQPDAISYHKQVERIETHSPKKIEIGVEKNDIIEEKKYTLIFALCIIATMISVWLFNFPTAFIVSFLLINLITESFLHRTEEGSQDIYQTNYKKTSQISQ